MLVRIYANEPMVMRFIAYPFPLAALFALMTGMFMDSLCRRKPQGCKDRELREHLSERQIDKMVEDSFPASDPPSIY